MKTKFILIVCLAALIAACSQKQSAVNVPVSHINVENLLEPARDSPSRTPT